MSEKLKLFLCLIVSIITHASVFAQASIETVDVAEAGTLQEIIEGLESSRFEYLTIKGNLNAKDIAFLRSGEGRVAKVETLDLSDVKLVPGDEPYANINLGAAPGGAFGFKYGIYYISDEYKEVTESHSSGLGGSNVYHHIYCNDLSAAFYRNNSFDKVVLPNSINRVGDIIFYEASIKEIYLPANAKSIGNGAFGRCEGLDSVNIPQNLESIGDGAFSQTSVTELALPSTVREIKANAFQYSKLESINLDDVEVLGEGAFYSARELQGTLNLSKIEVIPSYCFGGTKISSPIFSPSLRRIEKDGFSGCRNIEHVAFGENLEYIGEYAFSGCSKLTEVELPSSVKQIGTGAFSGTPWGNSLVSEGGIIYIGNIAYSYDSSFNHEGTELSIREGTIAISDGFQFSNSVKEKVTSLNLPESLLDIGNEAFRGFKELGEVKLPSSLQRIGNGAFRDCPKFWCALPENLVVIGERAFESCGTLSKATLPESLKYIGGGVFNDTSVGTLYLNSIDLDLIACGYVYTDAYSPFEKCETLHKVVVGPKVTRICDRLFYYNQSLKTVVFEDIENSKLELLGDECFGNCENLMFETLPQSISHVGEGAFGACGFKQNISIDNVKYIGERAFANCKGFTSIRIPECVDTLGGLIFSGCKDLRHVEFNAKEFVGLLYSVGYAGGGSFSADAPYIFQNCDSIESVTIGPKVKFLPYGIFHNCRKISEVKFESRDNEADKALSIGDYAFGFCGFSEIELPEGLEEIGTGAFYQCGLKSVTIPSTCRSIKEEAFGIYYWNNIFESMFFKSHQPPTIEVDFTRPDIIIYVPKESYNLYQEVPALQGYDIRKMVNGGIAIESISLNPGSWEGSVGSSFTIEATVYPDNALDKRLSWTSSDETVAKVDEEGNVTTLSPGDAQIIASALDGSEVSAVCALKVYRVLAESIQLSTDSLTGVVGSSFQLEASIYPENTSDKTLQWTSGDEGVAAVDSVGKVIAKGVGVTQIMATTMDGTELSASCHVTVLPQLVESIQLSPDAWKALVGEKLQLEATVSPANATDNTIKWTSSDSSIVEVNEDGLMTAIKIGEADITATASDGSDVNAVCHVIVDPVLVEDIKIDPTEWEGVVGDSFKITATVYPENATDKKLIWTSTDESVASVYGNGYIYALKEGEAYITVKPSDGSDISAVCHVKVTSVAIESILLNPESWSGTVGASFKIDACITPENATYKTLVWTSSDEAVAKVDSEGNVTAVNVGEADIVATASDGSEISAICHVSVMPVLVESIVLTPDSWSGEIGDSFQIQASVYPENATDKTLDWISSDEEIAKVDSDGLITLYKEGSCTITVLSTDGSNISAECYITGTADLESLLMDDNVEIDIYDMNGILVRKNCSKDVLKQLTPDIYLVRVGHQVKCIVIR